MEIIKKRIADMERAEYNPRVELMPGDDEYEKLKRNIDRFGVVVPVIWNKRTNRVVSGHQRLTVLMNEGVTETDVSVVDLDETAEKQLNIAMNKVTGEWDEVKLKELLDGLGDAAPETGFDLYEIDRLERGTPSYEERLAILKTVSARVQRTIVRIQPYMPEVFHDVMKNIPRIAEAGAYGVIVEGMKFFKAKPGMTKIGGDFCYPLPRLRHDFEAIKAECHRYGLKFYSGENRLRAMGDSMTCCGIDGLPGFRPNEYNLCMLMNGKNPEPTEKMKEVGTGGPFKTLNQSAGSGRKIAKQSFYGLMQEELAKKTDYHRKVFGLDE